MRPPDLPKCIYVRANHSWSSFTYRSSEYKVFYMNLCKSPFLIMCWLASFTMNAAKVNSPSESSSEERGGVTRAQQHLKENDNTACSKKSCFWQGKKRCFLHYQWEILTKLCYRLFIKTLKNNINLWKIGIMTPLMSPKSTNIFVYTFLDHFCLKMVLDLCIFLT